MILEQLTSWFNEFNTYSKANPIVAGAISLWGLGVLTFLAKGLPKQIFNFVKKQCTTTLYMNNAIVGNNMETFNSFLAWVENSKWSKWSRSMSVNGQTTYRNGKSHDELVIGIGLGNHFFMFNNWPFWVRLMKQEKQNNSSYGPVGYEVVITALGRRRSRLNDLIEVFKYKEPEGEKRVPIYKFSNKDWNLIARSRKRSLDSVVLPKTLKDDLLADITKFKNNREWYEKRGFAYKRIYIFAGPPGTGKTSVAKALASFFEHKLYTINLRAVTDDTLMMALATVPPKTFVLIEDFDSCSAVKTRQGMGGSKSHQKQKQKVLQPSNQVEAAGESPAMVTGTAGAVFEETGTPQIASLIEDLPDFSAVSLSGILNAFDGVVPLDDVIIILTTNVLRDIDPALLRAGRTDRIFEIPYLGDAEVREYIKFMYETEDIPEGLHFGPLPGCDLQQVYEQNIDDFDGFIEDLFKYYRENHQSLVVA